jgi:hypothetical protein
MKLALFLKVCEGEYEMAWDAMMSLVQSCQGANISLFVLDDASPSRVGKRLVDKFYKTTGNSVDCLELPQSLGYRGSGQRAFIGLNRIANSGKEFDMVVKIDADALVIRDDLGDFLEKSCPNGVGLYGEGNMMRWRDRILYLADFLPIGFKRKSTEQVIQREWELSRIYPVWWADLGMRSLFNGFQFKYIPGCFWYLGGKTLQKLKEVGYLSRDQNNYGFVFNDDLLLTTAVYAINHPVVDLTTISPHWKGSTFTSEETPLIEVKQLNPYVIHPLKNKPKAWERRTELKALSELKKQVDT